MSMLWLLERMFESPDQAERFARDHLQDVVPDPRRDAAPPLFRCRVCGLVGEDGTYCPTCLADTMVMVKPGEPGSGG
jgi:rubrerythrin